MICSNVIGGCQGTTGPACIDPATGQPYGLRFPVVTVADMVRAQKLLVDHLGIDRLLVRGRRLDGRDAGAGVGLAYPEMVGVLHPDRHDPPPLAQQIAFNEVGRQAIMRDPNWSGGDYYGGERRTPAWPSPG